jgi:undecaprenyl-diphosphatase
MSFLDSIILGIVEGITEFLPVSSTGHLILTSAILHLTQTDFLKSFEIIIQLGAILAVVVLYWKTFLNVEVLKKIAVAFLPTGVIGLALYKIVKTYLIGNTTVVLLALLIGGIALIVFEVMFAKQKEERENEGPQYLTYKAAFFIGLFQSIAIIPGISRSAASIMGGLFLGFPRRLVVEFSFLLAVPTMLAASGLDIVKSASSFSLSDVGVLVTGFVVSFIVAIFSIKFLLRIIKTHTFIPFGIYRIIVSLLFYFFVLK